MNPVIFLLLFAHLAGAEELRDDMMSFSNGDKLHGSYSGMEGQSVLWKRDDVGEVVKFKTSDLRRIVLRGGRPEKSLGGLSHIGTINGDRIPGVIRDMDDTRLLLDTEFGGTIEIPRNKVGLLAPTPLGGRIIYQGPFDEKEWKMIDTEHPEGIPAPDENAEEEDGISRWNFSGSAWYWKDKGTGTALVLKEEMPARSIIRFDIAWKNRLQMAIAFHADFKQPEPKLDEDGNEVKGGRAAGLPGLFGNSYVLHLYSNYLRLFRTSFDKDGNPRMEPVQMVSSGVGLGDTGTASVEMRCNRDSGEIMFFINGEFIAQWSELGEGGESYAGLGGGLGFAVQADDSPARLSEVIVAEWNGMPDSARSLQVDDADIVLLANGTDRFAGKIKGLHDGLLQLESRYGNFEFPIADVAEVRFAQSGLAKKDEETTESMKVRLHPLGRITGKPLSGDDKNLKILSGCAGEIDIKLDSAVMLEIEETESFLDDWDLEF
ncbi:MAG: hypothetical protein NWT08_10695 [Akkermansiaceae bacterium]|nr:hypothetical protein [Akkermansiaceae bacterium]MDP4647268.1 hypothetical protein [Akkermansiaceae bacterium]MDP4722506.1 hypothetical protein [Akkermansiaceae bacterium]MDP4781048.1 hypothetical protein [Akkermansiaceae bacterium]MDP4848518.1 hypothetical protein [Akkermansiaceae bacterium]